MVTIATATVLYIAAIQPTEAHNRSECPASWPDWGFADQWTGPVWHIDRHGDRQERTVFPDHD